MPSTAIVSLLPTVPVHSSSHHKPQPSVSRMDTKTANQPVMVVRQDSNDEVHANRLPWTGGVPPMPVAFLAMRIFMSCWHSQAFWTCPQT